MAEGVADDVERRTRASVGDHALAFAVCGTMTSRAKIVRDRKAGNAVVATRLGVGLRTIAQWRKYFIADRVEGLYEEMRTGRAPQNKRAHRDRPCNRLSPVELGFPMAK